MYSAALSDIRAAFFMLLQASSTTSALCACDAMSEAPAYEQSKIVIIMQILGAPLLSHRQSSCIPNTMCSLLHKSDTEFVSSYLQDCQGDRLLHAVLRAYPMS